MEQKVALLHGNYYHIYNRGTNGTDIFLEPENYYHFLRLYAKYIEPIADTYAWCLMKNHFHVLVRIKDKTEINENELSYSTIEKPKVIEPYRQFSHLFNAYTQAINKRYKRTGCLFGRNFQRKLVTTEDYFRKLIFYIHNNPVHHGFVKQMGCYPWSSYESMVTEKPTLLKRHDVLGFYGSKEDFISYHGQEHHVNEILNLIIE
jgi:REP element-mobilizing transposase RayT